MKDLDVEIKGGEKEQYTRRRYRKVFYDIRHHIKPSTLRTYFRFNFFAVNESDSRESIAAFDRKNLVGYYSRRQMKDFVDYDGVREILKMQLNAWRKSGVKISVVANYVQYLVYDGKTKKYYVESYHSMFRL